MPRGDKSGSIFELADGRWCAKKKYTKLDGTEGKKTRIVASKAKATRKLAAILDEIDKELSGDPVTRHLSPVTFADLATHYENNYLKPAEWHQGRKVAGLDSHDRMRTALKVLKDYFGKRPLRSITWQDLADLKTKRLRQPVIIKRFDRQAAGPRLDPRSRRRFVKVERIETRTRSIASVQQPLKLARRMFNLAIRLGWMTENPFHRGDALIIVAHEKKRDRILSHEEEERLRPVCSDRLWELVMIAIDTAFRLNEQLSLAVDDVWLDRRVIRLRAENSKTEKERLVPITARMVPVLARLITESTAGRVFPPGTDRYIHRHFRAALELADVKNFQWRDLRHTATSRMVAILKNPIRVMKITGHTNYKTFIEVYVNIDEETAREIGDVMDRAHEAMSAPAELAAGVN
jgi:site-specific recombinase XerD